ncbi:unnamed protein product (mitochondrion) [Plasmodiophora brassicae]|uniref:Uncharacterized protein n=1 Tax=Plasmodiophora brassicae TaxID=37360 RepID=A0A3P3YN68_PLABS|nr:unnamed protein product [Plasmodiophora brassicae]
MAEWARKELRLVGEGGYYALLTAASRLRMPTLGRALLSLKPNWADISAMTNSFPRRSEAFLFMVENCPIVAGLRRYIETDEFTPQERIQQQKRIIDRIPRAVAYGDRDSDVGIVNTWTWSDMYDNILQWASSQGNVRLVELLADIPGIDANIASQLHHQTTALHWAAFYGHYAVVQALLTIPGINVNAISTSKSQTPLHLAAFWGHANVVDVLLGDSNRIEVNVQDYKGRTALMLAASYGHLGVVQSLLSSWIPIQPNVVDIHQKTAFDLAKGRYPEIVSLLEDFGCLEGSAICRGGASKKLRAGFKHLWKKI